MHRKVPPFIANSDSNTHCLQASLKSIMSHFSVYSDKDFEFFDQYTGKPVEKAYTWPFRMMVNAARDGFEVINLDLMNLSEFIGNPFETMKVAYGEEIAKDQIQNSEIDAVVDDARELIESPNIQFMEKVPNQIDLEKFISDGYLVIINVNGKMLMGKEGYSGHFIVVFDFDNDGFLCHNSGLPPERSRYLKRDELEKVWAYGGESHKNLIALRRF